MALELLLRYIGMRRLGRGSCMEEGTEGEGRGGGSSAGLGRSWSWEELVSLVDKESEDELDRGEALGGVWLVGLDRGG